MLKGERFSVEDSELKGERFSEGERFSVEGGEIQC